MPDPSADRPPTPPEKLFSEEDEQIVLAAIELAHVRGEHSKDYLLADHVLTALASAGRLLPEDAEHDEEFAVVGALPDGTPWASDPHYRLGDARQLAAMMAPGAVIKRRLINAGPWVEVDPDA